MINRRSLITGLISFAAAPAIVRAASLMPVKVIEPNISMRLITDYLPINKVELNILYGKLSRNSCYGKFVSSDTPMSYEEWANDYSRTTR